MPRLELRNLSKAFTPARGEAKVLAANQLNLAVESKELLVVVGPSGSGKTVALRLAAGLERPDQGSIWLDGADVTARPAGERDIALVFQNSALYPHLTGAENIAFGLAIRGHSRADIQAKVSQAAALLSIEKCLCRKPFEMSGGERQRVALARALVRTPRVFLFDEPFASLDAPLRAQLRADLTRLHRDQGWTSVYVTHDQTEAMTLGDRIAVLHQGKVVQSGTPIQVYRHPANLFVASFFGSPGMNLLPGRLVANGKGAGPTDRDHSGFETDDGKLRLRLPTPSRSNTGARVVLGVRPEDLRPDTDSSDPGDLQAVVESVRFLGPCSEVALRAGGIALAAQVPWIFERAPGTTVRLRINPEAVHWFDGETGLNLAQ